jgi:hypothetical protein
MMSHEMNHIENIENYSWKLLDIDFESQKKYFRFNILKLCLPIKMNKKYYTDRKE